MYSHPFTFHNDSSNDHLEAGSVIHSHDKPIVRGTESDQLFIMTRLGNTHSLSLCVAE